LARVSPVRAQADQEHPDFAIRKTVYRPPIEISVPDNLIDTFDGTVACADPNARIRRRSWAGLRAAVGRGSRPLFWRALLRRTGLHFGGERSSPAATLRMLAGPAA